MAESTVAYFYNEEGEKEGGGGGGLISCKRWLIKGYIYGRNLTSAMTRAV